MYPSKSIFFTGSYDGKIVSINSRYTIQRGGRRLILTPAYRAFKEAVRVWAKSLYQGKPKKYRIAAYIVAKTAKDIDNIKKALYDGLEGVLYEDDKQVVEEYTQKVDLKKGEKESISVHLYTFEEVRDE